MLVEKKTGLFQFGCERKHGVIDRCYRPEEVWWWDSTSVNLSVWWCLFWVECFLVPFRWRPAPDLPRRSKKVLAEKRLNLENSELEENLWKARIESREMKFVENMRRLQLQIYGKSYFFIFCHFLSSNFISSFSSIFRRFVCNKLYQSINLRVKLKNIWIFCNITTRVCLFLLI